MIEMDVIVLLMQFGGGALGQGDGAVFAACAAKGEVEIAAAFTDESGKNIFEHAFDLGFKFGEVFIVLHEFLYGSVKPCEGAQFLLPMGVAQKAAIENHVGIGWGAEFIGKALHGHLEFVGAAQFELAHDFGAEFVRVEAGGFDDDIGHVAQIGEHGFFVFNGFGDTAALGVGVDAAGLVVAPGNGFVIGFEKEEGGGFLFIKIFEDFLERAIFAIAFAGAEPERQTARSWIVFNEMGNEIGWEVVHPMEAAIFQSV